VFNIPLIVEAVVPRAELVDVFNPKITNVFGKANTVE